MGTFNAGAIEAKLTLGRSAWTRDLRKTKQEIAELERKSISIDVDLDTDNAQVAISNLELFLEDLDGKEYAPTVDLVVREAMERLEELEARLDALDARRVTVEADADTDNATIALDNLENHMDTLENDPIKITAEGDFEELHFELMELESAIDTIDGQTINIDTDVDLAEATAEMAVLQGQIDAMDGQTINIDVDYDEGMMSRLVGDSGGGGHGGYMGLLRILIYAIIALSPVLVVAMSAASAAIVGFTGAVVAALGPLAVLGAGIAGLVQRFKEAKEAGELTGPMQALDDALTGLSKAWNHFLDLIEDEGFALMADGVNLLADIIPTLAPLFNATAEAMGGVLGALRDWIDSPEYDEMLAFFQDFGIDMLVQFIEIIGRLIQFFGRLFSAMEPFIRVMMDGLQEMVDGWAEWADDLENNNAFQDWMDRALEYGPRVLDMLGSLWDAWMNISAALEPFAGPMLDALTWFFDLIANADTDTLTIIIGALAALWATIHIGIPIIMGLINLVGGIATAIGFLLSPIGLWILAIAGLVAAIVYLWNTNEEFRQTIMDTWTAIQEHLMPIVEDIVAFIMENWEPLRDWIMGIWGDIQTIIMDAAVIIKQLVRALVNTMLFLWRLFGDSVLDFTKRAFQAIGQVIQGAFQVIKGIFGFFKALLTGDWRGMWNSFVDILQGAWEIIKGVFKTIINPFRLALSAVKDIWDRFVGWLERIGGTVGSAVSGMWDGLVNAFKTAINYLIGLWNGINWTIDIPDAIPGLPDDYTVSVPHIEYLARGAYVTSPTLAMVGEGGENELVAPEPMLKQIVREESGGGWDYPSLAKAIVSAFSQVLTGPAWDRLGGLSREDFERLLEAAGVNVAIDARDDKDAPKLLAEAIGFELRRLGYGGKR